MVELGNRNTLLLYTLRDAICGILVGLRDSFFGLKGIVFNIVKGCKSKDCQHDSQDSSASVSERKSRSRKEPSKNLNDNEDYSDVTLCAKFNGLLFILACGVYLIINAITIYICNFDESSWMYFFTNAGVISVIITPVYITSKLTNTFWLKDLSNKVYCKRYGSPSTSGPMLQIGSTISDVIFSIIIEALLVVQAVLLEFLLPPTLAQISNGVHYSLLNALYSFEYLWGHKGWGLNKRISYLEANWPYFMGFGLPLTTITCLIPLNIFFCGLAFSVCYPFFIAAAINAPPLTVEQRGPSLKVFCVVIWFTSKASKAVPIVWRLYGSFRNFFFSR